MFRKQKDTAPDATRVPVLSRTDADGNPLWVGWIQDWVRPAVAVVVLVMSAPGEHYLAREGGWANWLAWGMPAVLTMYAGVAAVVATKRPAGAPGKNTAVVGAVLSILMAMAAQPVAHLYKSGWEPGNAWTYHQTLTVVVSCIPALVFGHLLHLAASPAGVRVLSRVAAVLSQDTEAVPAQDTVPLVPAAAPVPVPDVLPAAPVVPAETVPGVPQDTAEEDTVPSGGTWDTIYPPMSQDIPAERPRVLKNGSMKSFVLEILSRGEDTPDSVLKDMIVSGFDADAKPNTMNKSISRARATLAQTA